MITKIVTLQWQEPEPGITAVVWCLSIPEWESIDEILTWVASQVGTELGNTIAQCEVHPTIALGPRPLFTVCAHWLAAQVRYTTGEGIYAEDCPVFAAHGIVRS